MRNKIACLAPLITAIGLYAFAQSPGEKSPKNSDPFQQKNSGKNKSPDTAGDKKAEKPVAGGLKLGVATDSEKLLDEAIARVDAIKKFHADVRQKSELLGYTFTAEGQYAVAPDFHMLYELKVQLTNDTTGSIKEVCDGRWHWRNQKVLDTQELVKVNIQRLREVFDKPQFNKDARDQLVRQLGFSGMVPFMKGLRETQVFESDEEGTINGQPVHVLHGHWREEAISQTAFRGQQLSLAKLPTQFPFVPSQCTVWIGREDGWLHKVELEGSKKVQGSVTRMTFEFLNPRFDADLPESLFAFEAPAGVRAEDQTEVMYQRLTMILQQSPGSDRRPAAPAGSDATSGDAAAKQVP